MTIATAMPGQSARRPPDTAPIRAPNRLAERITGRPYLSHTQIGLMRSCPRKFAFQYVERAAKDFLPSSLIFGGAIHNALEFYFRAKLEGTAVTAPALQTAYQDAWQRQRRDAGMNVPVRFNKGEDENSLTALADRIIDVFLASPLANPKGVILGIEEELRVVIDPELPDLLAKVDLVSQTDGALHVIDFKTSRSKWNEQKAQDSSEQLLLYGVAVNQMSKHLGLPVKLHFAIITKAKQPIVQLLPVQTDVDRTQALRESVAQIWTAIQAGNYYANPSPQNCAGCQFRSRCPTFAKR